MTSPQNDDNLDRDFNLRGVVGDIDIADAMSAFSRMRFQHQRLLDTLGGRAGVTPSDIRAIFFLGANAGTTPKGAAEFLGLTTGAMTSLVDRNEKAGLVRRVPNPRDRRSVTLELTDAGRETLEYWVATYRDAFLAAIPDGLIALVAGVFKDLAGELAEQADRVARER